MTQQIEHVSVKTSERKRSRTLDAIARMATPLDVTFSAEGNIDNERIRKIKNILGWNTDTLLAVVYITPEMAEELLAFNEKNRKLIKGAVEKYSQSLIDGDFKLSNDMITFDKDGILTNGQHRLIAVTKTRKPLTSVVMIGVEQSSEMDRGAKRNVIDNITIAGNIDVELQNANIIKTSKALFDHVKNRQKYTCAQLEDFMMSNKDAIMDAHENNLIILQGKAKYVFNVQIAAAFLAAVIYYRDKYVNSPEIYDIMLNRLVHFRDVLTTSIAENNDDQFIIRLREKIKDSKKDGRRLTADALFRSTQYTLFHYCNGETKPKILCNKDYFM